MPSSYPTGFDAMGDPGANLSGPPTHSSMHNAINDAIEAMQAEMGLSPSGAAATVAARFTAVDLLIGKNYKVCTSSTRPGSPTEGDLIYETDTDRMLVYNGSAWVLLDWSSSTGRPGVALTDVTQSIANATLTDITWGTEVLDVDGWTSGGTATLTVPTGRDGLYLITFNAAWSTSALGVSPYIVLNAGGLAYVDSGLNDLGRNTVTALVPLAATNTVVCQAKQNSGGSVTISSHLDITWLGR